MTLTFDNSHFTFDNTLYTWDGAGPLLVVPNLIGMYYYDAQLAILQAGFLIAPPTWVLSGTFSLPGVPFTADSSITADSSVTSDAFTGGGGSVSVSIPGIVVGQSLNPGFGSIAQIQVAITVIGFPVLGPFGILVPVP